LVCCRFYALVFFPFPCYLSSVFLRCYCSSFPLSDHLSGEDLNFKVRTCLCFLLLRLCCEELLYSCCCLHLKLLCMGGLRGHFVAFCFHNT
jgi:hypothetical protein